MDVGVLLISATLSPDPRASFGPSKQLVLFLIVPAVYRFVRGSRGHTLLTVVLTCAAISALIAPRLNGGPELPLPDGWPLAPEKGSNPNDIGSPALGCPIESVGECWID